MLKAIRKEESKHLNIEIIQTGLTMAATKILPGHFTKKKNVSTPTPTSP